jgi:tetratricopeptide (TPR) repeat protein
LGLQIGLQSCHGRWLSVNESLSNNLQAEHGVRAAQGWFERGLSAEAEAEIARLPETLQLQPEVLKLRFHAARACKRHDDALGVALSLMEVARDELWGWLYRSQALHWLGRTSEAYDLLLPIQSRWTRAFEIPYDLACYCAQSERIEIAAEWFSKAVKLTKHPAAVKSMALADPDLKPLWADIEAGRMG